MKFRTTCPHCDSVLRLTAEQLEAAQGWGQCSVCAAAFNMRTSLAAENGDPLPLGAESPVVDPTRDAGLPDASAEDVPDSPHPAHATPDVSANDAVTPPDALVVSPLVGIENRAGIPELTSIILIDPDADVPNDYGPLPVFRSTSNVGGSAHKDSAASVYGLAYTAPSAIDKPVQQVSATDVYTQPQHPEMQPSPIRGRSFHFIWVLVSLVLLLVLVLQLAYFLRDTLASKVPTTRPWLETACAKLRCSLSLPKDAALIQIIGSDLQAEPAGPGHLQLKLTLGNRAPYAQAWPVLVLTLTDQKDQAQARRSFAPSEYLADQKQLTAGIPAQSEHPLSLPLEVRSMPVSGYRLEIAY